MTPRSLMQTTHIDWMIETHRRDDELKKARPTLDQVWAPTHSGALTKLCFLFYHLTEQHSSMKSMGTVHRHICVCSTRFSLSSNVPSFFRKFHTWALPHQTLERESASHISVEFLDISVMKVSDRRPYSSSLATLHQSNFLQPPWGPLTLAHEAYPC